MRTGFTIIEIVIVMAIILILGVTGIIFGIDTYSRSVCHSERDKLVSLLYRVRSRAMNNMNGESQGLHFENNGYILFSGNFYEGSDPFDETITRAHFINISSSASSSTLLPNDLIFEQLTGDAYPSSAGDIFISDSGSTCHDAISVNREGGIDW